ncbi:hypothetical protein ACQKLP_12250 [Chitinophaga sp. NPDC101104]|uniref:hypothetical protein n=1 Tax=Chitinophaga sp. NPDC101104 TaxID=3390561 RepID=UPI003D05BEC7
MKKLSLSLTIVAALVVVISAAFKINHWNNADVMSQIGAFALPVMLIGFSVYIFSLVKEKLATAKQRR